MDWLITIGLGFALGFLIGLTGVGGGALVAPALYVILGLDYAEAIALSLVYSVFTKITGAAQHVLQRTVVWKITVLYGLTGIPGAVLGAKAVYWLAGAERVLPFVMSGILFLVSGLILAETGLARLAARPKPFSPHQISRTGALAILGFQLVVGVLLGATSIGSGSLVMLSMLFLFRMSAREIVGSNIVIALIMVVPAGLAHYAAGGVRWSLLALLLAGSLIGSVLGARATMRMPERALKLLIVVLVVVGALATMGKAVTD